MRAAAARVLVCIGVVASVATSTPLSTAEGSAATSVRLEPGAAVALPVHVTMSGPEDTPQNFKIDVTAATSRVVEPVLVEVFLGLDDESEADPRPPPVSIDSESASSVLFERLGRYCGDPSCEVAGTLLLTRQDAGVDPVDIDITIDVVLSTPGDGAAGSIDEIVIDAPDDT